MDIIEILTQISKNGHAPLEGCSYFGVGYEDVFDSIRRVYLETSFDMGISSEKFVIGPWGSGKTHFMRQLMEIARSLDCVTSEVQLNTKIDYTQQLTVYKEIARKISVPGYSGHGMKALITAIVERMCLKNDSTLDSKDKIKKIMQSLDKSDIELDNFAKVAIIALETKISGDTRRFDAACQWLGGEVNDKNIAKILIVPVTIQKEFNIMGTNMLMSLFQFIRYSGFKGTIVCLDEAEQGLPKDTKMMSKIRSMFLSNINMISDLRNGNALVVYALNSQTMDLLMELGAIRQRVVDPGPGRGFFDGNILAPIIDLTLRKDKNLLNKMGRKLVDLLYEEKGDNIRISKEDSLASVDRLAIEIFSKDKQSTNRRVMARRTSDMLLNLFYSGNLAILPEGSIKPDEEPEV